MDVVALLREVEQRRQATAEHILNGECRDHTDYRERMGRLRALEEVLSIPGEKREGEKTR